MKTFPTKKLEKLKRRPPKSYQAKKNFTSKRMKRFCSNDELSTKPESSYSYNFYLVVKILNFRH